ncbi:hypothetical protein LIER_35356 [Lithospermum erythrorhizon]|uniref:Protein PHLOEM PROTEIN 2-LIKE A10 n=1 Tax=Lithospermum erythrorhizon TaxID=34254 RepID=A0AAV3NPD9_LITER
MDYSKTKRLLVYALGALCVTGYGAHRVYNMPAMIKKRKRLLKLLGAFVTVVEMVSDSAEVIAIILKDLNLYIQSDADQIPRSLKQISKISRSVELSESVTRITRAVTIGILAGYQYEVEEDGVKTSKTTLSDRVFDKLFSDAGSGFASLIVGSFAKNLVMACYDVLQYNKSSSHHTDHFDNLNQDYTTPQWVNVLCEDKVRALIGECIQRFVSTAVSVYLGKTMHINTYDVLFSGLTNPKHDRQVRDLLVSVCNGAVGTFVRTSYNVMTHSDADSNSNSITKLSSGRRKSVNDRPLMSNTLNGLSMMSSTLDLTGRATSETFISYMKLLIENITEILFKSGDLVQEEVIDMGAEAFKYASRRSSAVVTICLSLCLHILNSPWLLVHT